MEKMDKTWNRWKEEQRSARGKQVLHRPLIMRSGSVASCIYVCMYDFVCMYVTMYVHVGMHACMYEKQSMNLSLIGASLQRGRDGSNTTITTSGIHTYKHIYSHGHNASITHIFLCFLTFSPKNIRF